MTVVIRKFVMMSLVATLAILPNISKQPNAATPGQMDFLLKLLDDVPVTSSGVQPVIWIDLINATAASGGLQGTPSCEGCDDAGAASQQEIGSSGGYFEFTIEASSENLYAGISSDHSGPGSVEIDYALSIGGSYATVRENGAYRSEIAAATGDVLRIDVENDTVTYLKNGAVFYTSTTTPSYPLQADASMFGIGAAIANTQISTGSNGGIGELDTDGDGIPDSTDIDDDGDGIPDSLEIAWGFDPLDPSDAALDADFDGASNLEEYQAGSDPKNPLICSPANCLCDSAPSPNPVIVPPSDPVSDSVGAITASFNVNAGGSASYSIPLLTPTGTADLTPNVSIAYTSGGGNGLLGLGWSMSGMSTIGRCSQTIEQDGQSGGQTSSGPESVTWTDLVRMTVSGNELQGNPTCEGCDNAGAASVQEIGSAGGYFEFTVDDTTKGRFVGLSNNHSGPGAVEIEYAIALGGNHAEVRENNVYKSETLTSNGDIFRISVDNNLITYAKNGTVFYTSAASPSYPLQADTSFYSIGASISDTIIDTGATSSGGGTVIPSMGVEFDTDDRFCLDGQRLVLANPTDTYGADGVEYRTEIDSNRKVVSYGSQGSGPSYFRVWHESGTVTEYGNTVNSQLIPTGSNNSVLTWGRNSVEDAYSYNTGGNNTIDYTYINNLSTSKFQLQFIDYARGSGGATSARVYFKYAPRPDPYSGYRAGTYYEVDQRLDTIDIENEGATLRTYHLVYHDELTSVGNNTLSRLKTITECRQFVRLPPTEFEWSGEDVDFSFATSSTPLSGFENYIEPSPSNTFSSMETTGSIEANVNGDGNRDLIWLQGSSGNYSFRIATSTGSTLITDTYQSTNFNEIYGWSVTDFDQDGYSDFLVVSAANTVEELNLFLNKDQGGGVRGYDVTPVVLVSDLNYTMGPLDLPKATFADVNNDSLIDVLYNKKYRTLEKDPQQVNGPYRFSDEASFDMASINAVASALYQSSEYQSNLLKNSSSTPFPYSFTTVGWDEVIYGNDFNADGLADAIVPVYHDNCTGNPGCETVKANTIMFLSDGAGGFTTFDYVKDNTFDTGRNFYIVDLNRDGLPDVVFGGIQLLFNTGTEFAAPAVSNAIRNHGLHSLIDYNMDGYLDYVSKDDGSTAITVQLWNGADFDDRANRITVANADFTEEWGPAGSFIDINGDGLKDYVNFNTGVYLGEDASTAQNSTKSYGLITSITNGLGSKRTIEYKPLTDNSVYVRESGSANLDWGAVVFDYIWPRYIVSRIESVAPAYDQQTAAFNVNAVSALSYTYAGLKRQPAGRGFLGFRMNSITDEQTGVVTENTFLQQFPFTGLLAETKVYAPGNSTPLSESSNTFEKLENLNGADLAPFRPAIAQSTTLSRAADSVSNSDQVVVSGLLSTTLSEYENYDVYGNPAKLTVTQTGDGNTYSSVTENTYSNNVTDWHIGRLLSTKVTTSQTGLASVIREASFTYDSSTGLVDTETQEPNNSQYTLTTTYLRDSFGNRIRATESVVGLVARYTRVDYDNDGRYIDTIYNSLEQAVLEVIARNEYGSPTITANISGVLTQTGYGSLGREYFQGNDSGSTTQSEYRFCSAASCPTGASYRQRNFAADGSESFIFFDNLGRPIQQQVKGFDGQLTSSDTYYDQSGRIKFSSNPYLPGGTLLWSSNDYDVLGRVYKSTDADDNISTASFSRYSNGSFVGMQIVETNAEGQTQTSIHNGLGLTDEVVDDLGGRLGYEYDARGNLAKLISKGSSAQPFNIETSIAYDLLGRRISLDDPDQGVWDYEYNGFGELTKQTDALNQSTEMSYDSLSRILTRTDKKSDGTTIEGNTVWTYDSATNGIGRIDTVVDTISDYTRAYDYDGLGRINQTFTSLGANGVDGTYSEFVSYDQVGRVFQQLDATYKGLQYSYNNQGYFEEIVEASNTNNSYYKVQGIDAWGNVSQSLLGNGLTVQQTYQATTGLPDRTLVTNPLSATIQDNEYEFNKIGILTNRSRLIESNATTLSEIFHYDELNRLTQATASGLPSQTFQYDIIGNMTYKSDVGTYSYGAGAAGPHAVTSAGGTGYTYDATGNMLTGGGRTAVYNTFRKPIQITKGGAYNFL